jgi:hypothetical protein
MSGREASPRAHSRKIPVTASRLPASHLSGIACDKFGTRFSEADGAALRLDSDRRLMLRFHVAVIISYGGLLTYRQLDHPL